MNGKKGKKRKRKRKKKKEKKEELAKVKNDKRGRRKPRGEGKQFFLHESRSRRWWGSGRVCLTVWGRRREELAGRDC